MGKVLYSFHPGDVPKKSPNGDQTEGFSSPSHFIFITSFLRISAILSLSLPGNLIFKDETAPELFSSKKTCSSPGAIRCVRFLVNPEMSEGYSPILCSKKLLTSFKAVKFCLSNSG